MLRIIVASIVTLAVATSMAACRTESAAQPTAAAGAAAKAGAKVAAVVFLGQKEACDCTKERIAKTWSALEAALAGAETPVQRIEIDVDPDLAEHYEAMQDYLTIPAVYLLDQDEKLVAMVQGEVSEKKLRIALGR